MSSKERAQSQSIQILQWNPICFFRPFFCGHKDGNHQKRLPTPSPLHMLLIRGRQWSHVFRKWKRVLCYGGVGGGGGREGLYLFLFIVSTTPSRALLHQSHDIYEGPLPSKWRPCSSWKINSGEYQQIKEEEEEEEGPPYISYIHHCNFGPRTWRFTSIFAVLVFACWKLLQFECQNSRLQIQDRNLLIQRTN